MKGRAGVLVLALGGLFIGGVLVVSIARRGRVPDQPETPSRSSPPTHATPEPAPKPVDVSISTEAEDQALRLEVVDPASKPVGGARAFNKWHMGTSVGTTDDSGLMTIPYSAVSNWNPRETELRIEHALFAPQLVRVRRSNVLVRVMLKPSAIVDLEVVNTAGQPLAGAEVQVDEVEAGHYSAPYMKRFWKTGETGFLRLTGIPFGALVIRAQATGYEEGRVFIIAHEGEPRTAKLILTQGRILNVTVRSSDGAPVMDAKVDFSDGSTWGMSSSYMDGYRTYHWTRQTDKEGRASFDHLPSAMNHGWLRAKTRTLARVVQQLQLAESITNVEVTLEPGGTLVVDAVDSQGRSIACRVVVSGQGFELSPEPPQEKAAGAKATFEGLPTASPLNLTLSRDNGHFHFERGIILSPSETRELTIQVPLMCHVKFAARDKQGLPVSGSIELTRIKGVLGPPVAGLQHDYLSYNAAVGEDGTCELAVFVGLYKVRFSPYEGPKVEKEVRVERDLSVDLEVDSQFVVTGVLVDPAGRPIPGVRVFWNDEKGSATSTTGPDGRFTLKRITGGTGKIYVTAGGGVTLEMYAGSPPVEDVRLVFPISTLRGKVVRENGDPGWGLVHVFPGKSPGFLSVIGHPPVSTRRDGTFELRLATGRWMVRVFAEGSTEPSQPEEVDLTAPGNIVDRVFTLTPAPKKP